MTDPATDPLDDVDEYDARAMDPDLEHVPADWRRADRELVSAGFPGRGDP